jgi:tetratricopeptide (TPR) repeat protein
MEDLIRLIWGFLRQHWNPLLAITAILVPIYLFWLQQRREKIKQWVQGGQYYRQAKSLHEQIKKSYRPSGEELDDRDPYDEVIGLCRDALHLGYQEYNVYRMLGEIYDEQERMEQALDAFRAAVKRNKRCVEDWYKLARTQFTLERDKLATHSFEQVLRLEPHNEYEKRLQEYAQEYLYQLRDKRKKQPVKKEK